MILTYECILYISIYWVGKTYVLSLFVSDQIIGKDLFRVVKEKYGENLGTILSEKIVLVPGDISLDDGLGVKDSNLKEQMYDEVDIIVNLAATTNFDER